MRLTDSEDPRIKSLKGTPLHFKEAYERRVVIKSGSALITLVSLEEWMLVSSGSND